MLAVHNKGRVNNDDYETCPQDIRIMLKHCKSDDVVWDPFVCNGFSQKYIEHLGYRVHENGNDDFFELQSAPTDVTIIVTNPPFSNKPAVLKQLLRLGVDFVVILPSTILTRNYFVDAVNSTVNTHEWTVEQPTRVISYHRNGVIRSGCPFNSMFISCKRRAKPLRGQSIADVKMTMLPYTQQRPFHVDGDHIGEDIE